VRSNRQAYTLVEHGLELASAHEYVRQTQRRLLIAPVLARLRSVYPSELRWRSSCSHSWPNCVHRPITHRATDRPTCWRCCSCSEETCVIAICRGCSSRHASARCQYAGCESSGALIQDSLFTEPSMPPGQWLSVTTGNTGGSQQAGRLRVWEEEAGPSMDLAGAYRYYVCPRFQPDGRTLVSGSWDDTIRLWNLESGDLLWTGGIRRRLSVAFAPMEVCSPVRK